MTVTVYAGSTALPVRYESWEAWRRDVSRPLAPAPLVSPETVSCAACWGQGRLFEPAGNGEGLVPRTCAECAGSGLVSAAARRTPSRP
jgi:hypothetical protein